MIHPKRYFVAYTDGNGEAISDKIYEVDMARELATTREQIQEDILTYLAGRHECSVQLDGDDLCQIIVDNFKKCLVENE